MKIKLRIISSLLAALVLYGCSEDFIDVPSNVETEEAITAQNATELVNAIYNIFLQFSMSSFSWNGVSSMTSDDADKGSDPGDTGADKNLLDGLTFDATALSFNEVWEAHYDGIQRANQALSRLPDFELEANLKDRLIGEATFLRALMYFRLVKTFGGVPLISEVPEIDSDPETLLRRASTEDTYAFIEEDLTEAIILLPEKSEFPLSELGRATKGAAKTLLAKVSMYQNKWDQVLSLTNEVINSGEYSLTPDYAEVWKLEGENNEESIFEIQGRGELPAAGILEYSVSQGARGLGGWGWGFNTPTEDLANFYEEGDTRRDATIIFRGEILFDGREVPNTVSNPRYNQKAYSSRFTDQSESDKNIRILRYAEVLLMNAEAATQTGGDALTPLNQVRNRAGLADLSSADQAAVWRERRAELAFEHDRYFDLVRQGRAGVVLRAHGKPFVDGKHEVFPIPQQQINISNGILVQNNGY